MGAETSEKGQLIIDLSQLFNEYFTGGMRPPCSPEEMADLLSQRTLTTLKEVVDFYRNCSANNLSQTRCPLSNREIVAATSDPVFSDEVNVVCASSSSESFCEAMTKCIYDSMRTGNPPDFSSFTPDQIRWKILCNMIGYFRRNLFSRSFIGEVGSDVHPFVKANGLTNEKLIQIVDYMEREHKEIQEPC